jgi:hypothetical protein
MADITLRETEGRPLTFAEVDGNFSNLNNDKQETVPRLGLVTSLDASSDKLSFYDTSAATERAILPENILVFIERTLVIKCVADTVAPATGNGITHITIPSTMDGKNLFSAQAHVYTVGTASTITNIQLHNLTDGNDMLSTPITIDLNEKDSSTAATPSVIGSNNGVSTADVLRIDVDAVATNTLGLEVRMVFST